MKGSKLVFSVFFLLLVLVLVPLISGCPTPPATTTPPPGTTTPPPPETTTPPPETLKIGMITSVTGMMSMAFKTQFEAVQPTEDLLNQMGGITVNGKQYNIEIIVEDDMSSPDGAVAATHRLVQAGVRFLIPPMFILNTMAAAPSLEQEKILYMKTFGNGPEECQPDWRHAFLTCSFMYSIDPLQDYLVQTYPEAKRIALIPPDDPGAESLKALALKEFEEHGLEVVFNEAFPIGTEDFYPILTKALEQEPDAIFLVLSIEPWAAGIINQSRELGFTGPICGLPFGDANVLSSMLNPEYAYDIFHSAPDVTSDKMLPIVKDLRVLVEQNNTPFSMTSVIPLDSTYAMLQCIESAQSFDTDKIVDMIENNEMKSIDTIWGPGTWGGMDYFGNNHVIIRPITFTRFENGKAEFWFVEP